VTGPLGVIGVPTSAGAFAPGQEQAPAALRGAGLLDVLREHGADVRDHGDREPWRWRPDPTSPRAPLLEPEQVLLFGWGPEQATPFEREAVERHGLLVVPVDEVAADPEAAAAHALDMLEPRCDRLLVHFDVDVIDFTDVPLSENTGRNEGLAYANALRALARLVTSPKLAGLTITELNPHHAAAVPGSLERFAAAVGERLA
jgi:arginase family enzyme